MEHTFDTPDPIELVVELGAGSLHTDARATEQTFVRVTGPRADEFSVEHRGGTVSVIAPRGGFFNRDDHTVEVTLPEGSDLSTKTGSADTQAVGTYDAVRAKTGSGDFELAESTGRVVVDSGSGDITCDTVGAELRVKSGSGDVEVGSVAGTGGVSTGSGDVAIGRCGPSLVVKTGSGEIELQRVGGDANLTTGSGSVRVGRAERGDIRAKTGSGDIAVGVAGGTPVWTDVSTATGRMRNELSSQGKPADGQDHVELRLRTGTGDISMANV